MVKHSDNILLNKLLKSAAKYTSKCLESSHYSFKLITEIHFDNSFNICD